MTELTFVVEGCLVALPLITGVLFEVGVLVRACLDRVGVLTPKKHYVLDQLAQSQQLQ